MNDLDRELQELDRLRAPDLRDDIEARATTPSNDPIGMPRRASGSRLAAVALPLIASALVVVFVVRAFDGARAPEERRSPNVATSAPAAEPWAGYASGWTALPMPPEPRTCASRVWTGSELIVWSGTQSGSDAAVPGGFAFDPVASSWSEIPPAPHGGSSCWPGIWTGSEAVFWRDGLAFDPAAGTWREIAPTPHATPYRSPGAVWTGSELVVFGGDRPEQDGAREGAVYDPATDAWRLTPLAPLGLNLQSAAWTGSEAIFFGSLLDDRNHASTETSVGVAYDPVADTWRELPPSDLSPQATAAVWLEDRLLAWDYDVHSQLYDPTTDRWTEPVEMPLEFSECYPQSVAVDAVALAYFCGQAATFEAGPDAWRPLSGGPLEDTIEVGAGSMPLWRFVDLVAAGDGVIVPTEGITSVDGEACYGCPESPQGLWLFRPGP